MKKLVFILPLFLFVTAFAQYADSENRFQESEQRQKETTENNNSLSNGAAAPMATGDPGNPGDPVPINNYIPFLVITAMGIMAYVAVKRKKVQN